MGEILKRLFRNLMNGGRIFGTGGKTTFLLSKDEEG